MSVKLLTLAILVWLSTSSIAKREDWWVGGNFYQIYPRSFKDSNGDGIGDLNGVTEKLEHFKLIGITGIWLSPIFSSPMVDFGYDISDFTGIQEAFGTMEDFERLADRCRELDIKLILDFVPNHTSDKHEWFGKSINREPGYEDLYVWVNATYDANGNRVPPNNWLSAFRYGAWEWNEQRQQYYLHQFAVQQPDLDFRNRAVMDKLNEVLLFWLNKGVSGFRIDSCPFLYEAIIDGKFPDEPLSGLCPDPNDHCHLKHIYTQGQPENYGVIYEWHDILLNYTKEHGGETRILMTEAYQPLDEAVLYYGANGQLNGAQVPFNFEFITSLNINSTGKDWKQSIDSWIERVPKGGYANWVLGNHDNKRFTSRFGPERADMLIIMTQTLPGVAVTYYGEEIAMLDTYVSYELTVDPQACSHDRETYEANSRDPERTPMQWDNSTSAGFSVSENTWLPVSPDYKKNNVEAQLAAARSPLKNFIRLVQLRESESLLHGTYEPVLVDENILVYKRAASGSDPIIVVLNFGDGGKSVNLRAIFGEQTPDSLKVYVASTTSDYVDGQSVDPSNVLVTPYLGIALVVA